MSYIANEIKSLLTEKDMTAAELARAAGLTEAHVSRLVNAVQEWSNPEHLVAIATGITNTKAAAAKIHARLLYAHLRDELDGPGATLVDVALLTKSVPAILRDEPTRPILPPKMQDNLDVIAQHITHNRHVRDLIETAANICRGGSISQPDSK